VHSVGQRRNRKHLRQPLGDTESLVETVGLEKTTECMWLWWRTSTNARRDRVSSILRRQPRRNHAKQRV